MFRPVLETMLQAGHGARERSFLIRQMLAKYQPVLAAYPLEHGYPALPANWKNLPKVSPLLILCRKVVNKLKSRFLGGRRSPRNADVSLRAQAEAILNPSTNVERWRYLIMTK